MAEEDNGDILVKLAETSYTPLPSIAGWERDPELSNKNYTTYTKGGRAVVSYRGTDLTNPKTRWEDLGSDILLGLGLQDISSRMRNARKVADRAVKKYGRENVQTIGHSLGGTQSLYVNRKTGLPATAYNAGVSPIDVLTRRNYKPNATSYTAQGDVISKLSSKLKKLKTVVVKPKTKNAHSIYSFV